MLFDIFHATKDETKVLRATGRIDKGMSDYRRIEYASEWEADYRTRPVLPLTCDARIRFGM